MILPRSCRIDLVFGLRVCSDIINSSLNETDNYQKSNCPSFGKYIDEIAFFAERA
jgi:hypothetical protein